MACSVTCISFQTSSSSGLCRVLFAVPPPPLPPPPPSAQSDGYSVTLSHPKTSMSTAAACVFATPSPLFPPPPSEGMRCHPYILDVIVHSGGLHRVLFAIPPYHNPTPSFYPTPSPPSLPPNVIACSVTCTSSQTSSSTSVACVECFFAIPPYNHPPPPSFYPRTPSAKCDRMQCYLYFIQDVLVHSGGLRGVLHGHDQTVAWCQRLVCGQAQVRLKCTRSHVLYILTLRSQPTNLPSPSTPPPFLRLQCTRLHVSYIRLCHTQN